MLDFETYLHINDGTIQCAWTKYGECPDQKQLHHN